MKFLLFLTVLFFALPNKANQEISALVEVEQSVVTDPDFKKALEYLDQEDYTNAMAYAKKSASNGYCEGYTLVGLMYKHGQGVKVDIEESYRWIKKGAELGDAIAMMEEGLYYFDKEIYNNAFACFLKSAKLDIPTAQYYVGECYYNGWGVQKNKLEAIKWYEKAADNGNFEAIAYLGECYLYGDGVPKDWDKGIEYTTKAANAGIAFSQFFLGEIYYYGLGVNTNKIVARQWYEKAAKQGHTKAIETLRNNDFK